MEYLIGAGLATLVCVFAKLAGFDRDRVFYPMLVTVIASYYILFAVMGGSMRALALESLIAGAFLALAVAGFKESLWLDCSCPRRARNLRFLSSHLHSQSRSAHVVAWFLPVIRYSRGRVSCHAVDSALGSPPGVRVNFQFYV